YGGTSGAGVLFEYDPATNGFVKKIDFTFANGANPVGCLILNSNAKYYGMTGAGGTSGSGVLFEYDPATNVYTKKFDFNGTVSEDQPGGSLTEGGNGKFYATTITGGTYY